MAAQEKFQEALKTKVVLRHHTSLTRGYVSRKNGGESIVKEYKGRFGEGFVVLTPNWDSTRYCYITYYV